MQGTSAYVEVPEGLWTRKNSDIVTVRYDEYFYMNLLRAVCQGRQEDVKKVITGMDRPTFRTYIDSYRLVMAAVQFGRVCILRLLLSFGAVVNRPSREFSPLHLACLKGSPALAQCLLEAGADVDMRNGEGKTPLHFSVQAEIIQSELSKFGRTRSLLYYRYLSCSLTRLLIQHGASLNCMDYSGLTPLHYAVKVHNINAISVLLENNADIEIKDRYGRTPLWYAVNSGSKDLVHTLLRAGAQLERVDELGLTMLHVAVCRENIAMTRFLLQCTNEWNVDDIINKPSNRGESCLHLAVACLNTEIINILIDVGADVNQKSSVGNTPLITACISSRSDSMENCASMMPSGYCSALTPFADSSLSNSHSCEYCDVVKLLIRKNAIVSSVNEMGETALHISAKRNLLCVANILLAHGADVDAQDADGLTPVHLSVEHQGIVMTKMLLESGADADAKGVEYLTPLHLAVIRAGGQDDKAPDLVHLLIDYDADVNARNMVGLTPLHLVLRNSLCKNWSPATDSRIIYTLLQHGANVFAKSSHGQTPFSLAACWYSSSLDHPCGALRNMLYKVCLFGIKTAISTSDTLGSLDYETDQLIVELIESEKEHNFYLKCLEEVSSLKSNFVVTDVPYYDLLSLTTEKFSNYLRNPNFEEVLIQANYLQVFPIYGPIIQSKFKMASKRKECIEAGKQFFALMSDFLMYPRLPVICVEIILKYLKGNDFRNIKKILNIKY